MKKMSLTLFLALSAVAATGFAYKATFAPQATMGANDAPPPQVTDVEQHAMTPAPEQPATAPAPAETAAMPSTGNPAVVPHIEHYALPSVTVTAPRPSEDELLRNAVVDRLASDSRLAGRIGVESYRHVVSLTGRVTTTAQIERAETIARGVEGVRDVNNLLTARVGQI
ncbi:MAG TPA: BON domain-containing protein [Usitatibacter sp.]|nr:BON domain-containing protein [Usitatibacter sp.]